METVLHCIENVCFHFNMSFLQKQKTNKTLEWSADGCAVTGYFEVKSREPQLSGGGWGTTTINSPASGHVTRGHVDLVSGGGDRMLLPELGTVLTQYAFVGVMLAMTHTTAPQHNSPLLLGLLRMKQFGRIRFSTTQGIAYLLQGK